MNINISFNKARREINNNRDVYTVFFSNYDWNKLSDKELEQMFNSLGDIMKDRGKSKKANTE
jgi:hypothetical protein